MIYTGYQGIGKSTLAGKDNFIDLESGNFWVDGKRPEDWFKYYGNIANHLSKQGFKVFTSSHKVLRNYLKEINADFVAITPIIKLKDDWIKKLQDRYNITNSDKDLKALKNAELMYEQNVRDLLQEKNVLVIRKMHYDLHNLINLTWEDEEWANDIICYYDEPHGDVIYHSK